ncbi:hypothetical protein R3W88_009372 [Solanum pinnatisectum]|uniref:Uncharacterized protein n=1 Tax=Solanum pinnatisectum TaxID=50273 RepID=A0AAV9MB75_9SOLN|nr:hypothetical protein R3W88_009372 [Solanum pinnatisectum]
MYECMKNGLSICYWFEAFISVHSLRSCSGISNVCVGASLAFGAQGGGVIIVGHGETFLLRDARRKCMWCFEFVFMRQSAISVQTRRRVFPSYASAFNSIMTLFLAQDVAFSQHVPVGSSCIA